MLSTSLALDLVVLAIFIVSGIIYANKGFLAGVSSFVGTLVALLAALMFANFLAPHIFNGLFRPGLEERVTELLASGNITDLEELVQALIGFLPESLVASITEAFGASISFAAPDISRQIVTSVMAPLLIPFITIVMFLLLFMVLRLLVSLLINVLSKMNKVPLLGTANQILGAVMGVLLGFLYVFLIMCIIWAIDAAYSGSIATDYFDSSIVYNIMSGLNFFK